MVVMTAGPLDEELPSPSRALLYALLGLILIGVMAIVLSLLTQRAIPDTGSNFDQMEQKIATAYGAESVVYSSPATNTLTVTFQGRELKCTAPSEAEIAERKPMQCTETVVLDAK
jgi:hypothetical protein